MRRSTAFLLVAGLGGVAPSVPGGVAAQELPTPARITRLGSHRGYGPGIVAASVGEVRFDLARAAHVIVLRLAPDGSIQALVPAGRGEPTERAPGEHTIAATPPDTAPAPTPRGGARLLDPVLRSAGDVARGGRSVFPPAAGSSDSADAATTHYWLVIAADVATSAEELRSGLEAAMSGRAFATVEAAVRALPRELVGGRTRSWGAWYAVVRR